MKLDFPSPSFALCFLAGCTALFVTSCSSTGGGSTSPSGPPMPRPAWAEKLERGITSEMRVDLTAPRNPNANVFVRNTMLLTVDGSIRNTGGASLRPTPERGVIVLWSKSNANGKQLAFPWPRDLLKGRAVMSGTSIQDYSNFTLMKGNGAIGFSNNSMLAVCSNPLTATVDGAQHRCVIITHGFRISADKSDVAAEKRTCTGSRTTVWPWDRAFVLGQVTANPPGSALHEAAALLLNICK